MMRASAPMYPKEYKGLPSGLRPGTLVRCTHDGPPDCDSCPHLGIITGEKGVGSYFLLNLRCETVYVGYERMHVVSVP